MRDPVPFLRTFDTQRQGKPVRIVANDVADTSIGFDSDENEVLVIAKDGTTTRIARAAKSVIANRILDLVVERMQTADSRQRTAGERL